MTIDKWIAIGGLLTSFFSAVAAFLAIRQTIIQRLTSIKPQLIIKETTFTTEKAPPSQPALEIMGKERHEFFISVINIGLGAALKLKYQWKFDYTSLLKKLNMIDIGDLSFIDRNEILDMINAPNYHYESGKGENFNFINILGYESQKYFKHKIKPYELEYILPHNIDNKEQKIIMPDLIILLKINEALANSTSIKDFSTPLDGPKLFISYEDISGKKKSHYYDSVFRMERFTIREGMLQLEVSLEFMSSLTKTQRILKKLRKGYAEFVESIKFS
ncbi:hypothetical protein [Leclercia adecarboxylata]|uniref:hypothetical protein n=1 Tax=Leclercia adecarboxylata TaxID=83655 RepID=UPI00244B26A6|nr:hypothetical protein [Leclercia adecarboxylata]MDH0063196.1 hypothetical protein [Leclercia adecarboxylata]